MLPRPTRRRPLESSAGSGINQEKKKLSMMKVRVVGTQGYHNSDCSSFQQDNGNFDLSSQLTFSRYDSRCEIKKKKKKEKMMFAPSQRRC
jgi:hypothetical protein